MDGDAQRISQLCWIFFLKLIDDQDQELEATREDYKSPIPKPLCWRAWAADPEGITWRSVTDLCQHPALGNAPIAASRTACIGFPSCLARVRSAALERGEIRMFGFSMVFIAATIRRCHQ